MKHKERGNTHMAKEQLIFCGSSETFLDKALTADSNADNGGNAFRIPSLVNANNTLIAAIDRASAGRTGVILSWLYAAVKTAAKPGRPLRPLPLLRQGRPRSAPTAMPPLFTLIPVWRWQPNGDVILLADFWPECKGLHNQHLLDKHKVLRPIKR